jgi:hypothetical protein
MKRAKLVALHPTIVECEGKDVSHDRTALRNAPWGTREVAFYDPDGNGLFFYRDTK